MAHIKLEFASEVPEGIDQEEITQAVAMLNERSAELHLTDGMVTAVFVDDVVARRLNKEYAGNDYATDILSFNYLESGDAIDGVVGELIICTPIAVQQASEAGSTLSDEVTLLIVHGLLHLSGYDHQDLVSQNKMQLLQQTILSAIGHPVREFQWHD